MAYTIQLFGQSSTTMTDDFKFVTSEGEDEPLYNITMVTLREAILSSVDSITLNKPDDSQVTLTIDNDNNVVITDV
jgi:hypothetical protein